MISSYRHTVSGLAPIGTEKQKESTPLLAEPLIPPAHNRSRSRAKKSYTNLRLCSSAPLVLKSYFTTLKPFAAAVPAFQPKDSGL